MKRLLLLPVCAIVLTGLACVPPPVRPRPERTGPPAAAETPEYYARKLEPLLAALASDDPTCRQIASRELEKLCNQAGAPGAGAQRLALCRAMTQYLWPDRPTPARIYLLRQLERIGSAECVPALHSLLSDADPLVREHARRALVSNPAPAATDALCATLDRTANPTWRVALINALGARCDEAALSRLAYRAFDRNAQVAAAAIAALGGFDAAEAVRTLRDLLDSPDTGRAESAAAALLRIADRRVGSAPEEAAELYDILRDKAPTPATRRAALRGLSATAPDRALPALLAVMKNDPDATLQLQAARLIAERFGRPGSETLCAQFDSVRPEVQVVILDALPEKADTTVRETLQKGLGSEDGRVRVAAVRALGRLGDASDVLRLAQIAAESSRQERDAARQALARLAGKEVEQVLVSGAKSELPDPVRAELVRAIAARHDRAALALLVELAADASAQVRAAAFAGIGELGTPEQIPALLDLLKTETDDALLSAAEDAIASLCKKIDDSTCQADPLIARLTDSSRPQQLLILRLLGRVQTAAALEALRSVLREPDPEVVDAAVRAISGWADEAAAEDLVAIARDASEEKHRILALQGYIRLIRARKDRPPEKTFSMLQTALSLATRPDEKKSALAALPDVPSLPSLQLARQLLSDAQLRNEAAIAAAAIARALAALHPELANVVLEELLSTELAPEAAGAVRQTVELIEAHAGYIGCWLVAGPYSAAGKGFDEVFQMSFAPEQPDQKSISWQPLRTSRPDNPWVFDLRKVASCDNCCFYVKTTIWSDRAQPARLELGSDDGVICWLNGELVHRRLIHRAVAEGQDILPVRLRAGWNRLMLKIVNAAGGCGFCCAVRGPDGQLLPELKFNADLSAPTAVGAE